MDNSYILMNRKERIIQKCIAIAGWHNRIEKLRLKGMMEEADKKEEIIEQLIDELIGMIID